MRNYRDLKIWQKADELSDITYRLSSKFPRDELFNLTSQIRRASLSIPTNIVEGFYRTKKEFIHFLVIAFGSLKETDYLTTIALKRKYITDREYSQVQGLTTELSKMISVFIKKLTY